MAGPCVTLSEVDVAQVTLVMDNSIDVLMAGTDVAKRFPLGPNPFERPQPIAEHGFSALIRVKQGEKSERSCSTRGSVVEASCTIWMRWRSMPPTSKPSSLATVTRTTRWGCPVWWSGWAGATCHLCSIPTPTSNAS